MLTKFHAYQIAKNLLSEDGENSEYDRALLEFLSDAFGGTKDEIAKGFSRLYCGNCGSISVDNTEDCCYHCGATISQT